MDISKIAEFDALKEIDFLEPMILLVFVCAFVGDFFFWTIIIHYTAALFVGFILLPKFHHFIPRVVIIASFILPLPVLIIGLIVGIVLSNKLIEFAAVTVALIAVTAATVGTAAPATIAAEAGVVGAETAGAVAVDVAAETAGRVATEAIEQGGEKIVQKAVEEGVEKTVQKGAEEMAQEETEKTLGQKTKEKGLKYAERKLRGRRDELRKELFDKDSEDEREDAQESSLGGQALKGGDVVDLRGKGVGEQGAPPARLHGNDDDIDVAA
ncbi:MAG: hypothetical protein WC246_00175 [Candidatus Paceibacterota bacterium]|jgi:hypothetical protein